MKIITLLNEKGGVGKTTLATHLSAWLAMQGYRTLLIDADPQGNATVSLGLAKEPGLYNLLVRKAKFFDVIRPVDPASYAPPGHEVDPKDPKLFVLPGNTETRAIITQIQNTFEVMQRLDEVKRVFDFVFFDTSPTPSLLHGVIYLATHYIIYPTELEYLSFQGLQESLVHLREANTQRNQLQLPPIDILGFVPMKYKGSTLEHADNLEELKSQFGGNVWPEIKDRTIFPEATRVNKTVWAYADQSGAAAETIEVMQYAERILVNG